jgi:putative transposase
MQYGSKSYEKQKLLCDKAATKQARIRKDFLHKLTSELVSNYAEIKVDDFSFKGYVAIQRNARHAYRVAPCMLKEMLTYKCEERGVALKYVPKGTPTTQTCSQCGHRFTGDSKLKLDDRKYDCPQCGHHMDRDANAAINVFKLQIE